MPENKTITIITRAPNKTMGDVSAALKLIKALIKSNNSTLQININWLVNVCGVDSHEDISVYSKFFEQAQNLGVQLTLRHDFTPMRITMHDLIEKLLPETDFFIAFPIYAPLEEILLVSFNNKPILTFGEYNFDYSRIYKTYNYVCVKTGLGRQKLGIFIDESLDHQHESVYAPNEKESLLLKTLNIDISNPKTVRPLYFAYFNSHTASNIVNKKFFCMLSLLLQAKKGRQDVDLIIKLDSLKLQNAEDDDNQFNVAELELLEPYYSRIEIVDYVGNIVDSHALNTNLELPKIRIIDPFPLSTEAFKFLLSLAEPFAGFTGDQSLSEGITNNNIICYQSMSWKCKLFEEFLELCTKHLDEESKIVTFSKKVNISFLDKALLKNFLKDLAKFIAEHEGAILAEMKQMKQIILSDFNLEKKLIPLLREVVCNPEKARELFNPWAVLAKGIRPINSENFIEMPSQSSQPFASQHASLELLDIRSNHDKEETEKQAARKRHKPS